MAMRNLEIDCTKGLLTAGMILAHAIQFFLREQNAPLVYFSSLINLIAFSGFVFCFGFSFWLAYVSKPALPWPAVFKTTLKCYAAFIISGVAFRCLVAGEDFGIALITRIALLRDLPSYSEFLATFALMALCAALGAPLLRIITRTGRGVAAASCCVLAVIHLPPADIHDPLIGIWIGGASGVCCFPLVQYAPLFLLGMYIARHRRPYTGKVLCASLFIIGLFLSLELQGYPMRRFPPSAFWMLCSAGGVYMYYGLGILAAQHFPGALKMYFSLVGQNTLAYLVLSNLVLFTGSALGYAGTLTTFQMLVFYFVLLLSIFFMQLICDELQKNRNSLLQARICPPESGGGGAYRDARIRIKNRTANSTD